MASGRQVHTDPAPLVTRPISTTLTLLHEHIDTTSTLKVTGMTVPLFSHSTEMHCIPTPYTALCHVQRHKVKGRRSDGDRHTPNPVQLRGVSAGILQTHAHSVWWLEWKGSGGVGKAQGGDIGAKSWRMTRR